MQEVMHITFSRSILIERWLEPPVMCLWNQIDYRFLLHVMGQKKSGVNCIEQSLQFYCLVQRRVTFKSACILHIIPRLS